MSGNKTRDVLTCSKKSASRTIVCVYLHGYDSIVKNVEKL